MKLRVVYYLVLLLFIALNIGTNIYLKDAALEYYDIDEHLIEQKQLSEEQVDNMTYSFRSILSILAMFITITTTIVSYLYRNRLIEEKAHMGRRLLVSIVFIVSTLLSIVYAVGFYF